MRKKRMLDGAVPERRTSMSKKYYIAHEVAELLAEVIGDRCACNVNGNDEWLPMVCDFGQMFMALSVGNSI